MEDLRSIQSLIDPSRSGALAAGKTKTIWPCPECACCVLIESRDEITAGDGAKRDVIEGKGIFGTKTTANVFSRLDRLGVVSTHFVEQVDDRTFRARRLDMIPIKVVMRRIPFGSYLLRHPDAKSENRFANLEVEFFHKDDRRHSPIMVWDTEEQEFKLHNAQEPVELTSRIGIAQPRGIFGPPEKCGGYHNAMNAMRMMGYLVFLELERAHLENQPQIQLVNLKIECGFDAKTGELKVGDVITNDEWRIWPHGLPGEMLDKQVYRNLTVDPDDVEGEAKKLLALQQIRDNYERVAAITDWFVRAAK